MCQFDYAVAIRTLGTAGEKYQHELDSIKSQTVQPKGIYVYIADGYELPVETIGQEIYIRCKKGMVAQRALPYDEIDAEWILMLDDDVYLPPSAVETMYNEARQLDLDCIAADTFPNHKMATSGKILAMVKNWVLPRFDDGWAFKIGVTGSFSYNNNPKKCCSLSQTAAGPCSLWRKASFQKIRYLDEIWLDSFGFAAGDDMLCFYKLYRNKGRLGVSYDCGAVHLNAMSSRIQSYSQNSNKLYVRAMAMFAIWYRTQFEAKDVRFLRRILSVCCFSLKFLWLFLIHIGISVFSLNINPVLQYVKGNIDAYEFVKSLNYRVIANNYIANESFARN